MPGSKAVVAALLTQQGATLLWDSMSGPTSDVSVAIHAYYEAAVKAYNAKVTAKMETVYTHFSRISNQQQDYTRRQLRNVVDDLQRTGRSQGRDSSTAAPGSASKPTTWTASSRS